ncbi:hypothetical protein PUR32_05500 [Streptomyces sp. BE133]|nr:hypothetical protein [Streptomyces sp. BE133]
MRSASPPTRAVRALDTSDFMAHAGLHRDTAVTVFVDPLLVAVTE